jgi:hypothetical protein
LSTGAAQTLLKAHHNPCLFRNLKILGPQACWSPILPFFKLRSPNVFSMLNPSLSSLQIPSYINTLLLQILKHNSALSLCSENTEAEWLARKSLTSQWNPAWAVHKRCDLGKAIEHLWAWHFFIYKLLILIPTTPLFRLFVSTSEKVGILITCIKIFTLFCCWVRSVPLSLPWGCPKILILYLASVKFIFAFLPGPHDT